MRSTTCKGTSLKRLGAMAEIRTSYVLGLVSFAAEPQNHDWSAPPGP